MTEVNTGKRDDERVRLSELSGEVTLIDQLLSEQRSLSAVERFSQKHEDAQTPDSGAVLQRFNTHPQAVDW